jgi:hypothetical protein
MAYAGVIFRSPWKLARCATVPEISFLIAFRSDLLLKYAPEVSKINGLPFCKNHVAT